MGRQLETEKIELSNNLKRVCLNIENFITSLNLRTELYHELNIDEDKIGDLRLEIPGVFSGSLEGRDTFYARIYRSSFNMVAEGIDTIIELGEFEREYFYKLYLNYDKFFNDYYNIFVKRRQAFIDSVNNIRAFTDGKISTCLWSLGFKWESCKGHFFEHEYWNEKLKDYENLNNAISKKKKSEEIDLFEFMQYEFSILEIIVNLLYKLSNIDIKRVKWHKEIWHELTDEDKNVSSIIDYEKDKWNERMEDSDNVFKELKDGIYDLKDELERVNIWGILWKESKANKYNFIDLAIPKLQATKRDIIESPKPSFEALERELDKFDQFIANIEVLEWLKEKKEEMKKNKGEDTKANYGEMEDNPELGLHYEQTSLQWAEVWFKKDLTIFNTKEKLANHVNKIRFLYAEDKKKLKDKGNWKSIILSNQVFKMSGTQWLKDENIPAEAIKSLTGDSELDDNSISRAKKKYKYLEK